MLQDIKVTEKELDYMIKNRSNYGTESYIFKVDHKTAYKIFKTSSPDVLENKFQKVKTLHRKNIDFMVNPLATLSCGSFCIGYKMYFFEDCEWYQFPLNTFFLKDLKNKLLILDDEGIIYGDIWAANLFIFNGKLLLGDSDNIQIDGYLIDLLPTVLSDFYRNKKFNIDVHAFMHNVFVLELVENIACFRRSIENLKSIETSSFHEGGKRLLKDMSTVYTNPSIIKNRYLIDYLK